MMPVELQSDFMSLYESASMPFDADCECRTKQDQIDQYYNHLLFNYLAAEQAILSCAPPIQTITHEIERLRQSAERHFVVDSFADNLLSSWSIAVNAASANKFAKRGTGPKHDVDQLGFYLTIPLVDLNTAQKTFIQKTLYCELIDEGNFWITPVFVIAKPARRQYRIDDQGIDALEPLLLKLFLANSQRQLKRRLNVGSVAQRLLAPIQYRILNYRLKRYFYTQFKDYLLDGYDTI